MLLTFFTAVTLLQLPETTLAVSSTSSLNSLSPNLLMRLWTSLSASLSLAASSYSLLKASNSFGMPSSFFFWFSVSDLIVLRIKEVDLKLLRGAVVKLKSFLVLVLVGDGERSMVIFVVVVVLLEFLFVVVFEHTVCLEAVSSLPMRTTSPLFKIRF